MQVYRKPSVIFFTSAFFQLGYCFSPLAPTSTSSLTSTTTLIKNNFGHETFSPARHSQTLISNTVFHRRNLMNALPSSKSISVSISDAFDGGNGRLVKTEMVDGQLNVYVEMKSDPYTELEKKHHSQYFSFRSLVAVAPVVGDTNNDTDNDAATIRYVLTNAGSASFPKAWEGSTVFYTDGTPSDPSSWKRKLDTAYDEASGELSWTHHTSSSYFAYFPPYSYERHLALIARCEAAPHVVSVESLGKTLDGREMECITVGTGSMTCWIIHRQHPGETMAEFYAEGLLHRLLGLDKRNNGNNNNNGYEVDGMVKDVLKLFTFHIVPNMNPDGSVRGHLRTNAGGHNLNREWCSSGSEETEDFYEAPTLERSPEVYHVLQKMDETGCDVFLDVHGDEELPFNFLAGGEGCVNWSERLKTLHGAFLASYARANSDMQVPVAYDPEEPLQARTNVCSNQIQLRFNCLAATLEMPFKDCLSNPDPHRGWNGARSAMLGASVLDALAYVGPHLRKDNDDLTGVFREKEDAYVRPSADYKSI